MKLLFISAERKEAESIEAGKLSGLPEKVHILYAVQYKKSAEAVRKTLGKRVLAFQQVLGCSEIKPKASLLFVGSGRFHALQLALSTGREVYIYGQGKISQEEIEKYRKKEQAKLSKFYYSNNIGIIVSSKPGQNKIKQAVKLKQNLEKKYKDKKFSLFMSGNILVSELENFPVDIWLNTACPGLELDSSKILNYKKI